jgi:hemoglobin/transferrin/lactoferrin receptor protein
MKYFFSFLSLFISFSQIQAQEISILDKTTYQPLYNVSVTNIKTNFSTKTNLRGKVILPESNLYDAVKIEALGYQELVITLQQIVSMNYKVLLVEKAFNLNEIVVSANKLEESKLIVPQQIIQIRAKEIAFLNQSTTADLLQQTGQVQVQKSQAGGGSPIMRGFEANKILLVIDGVRMNNAIYRGGHLQNVITLDQNILEKTELVFGPGSVVYGSDALGGVIHFYTKKPILSSSDKTFFNANAYSKFATAANENTQHVNFNIGLKKIAFLSSLTYSNFGDLRQGNSRNDDYPDFGKRLFYQNRINGRDTMLANSNTNVQKLSGYKQYDLLQKIIFKPNNRITHGINLQYSTSSDINRYDRLNEYTGAQFKFAEWYYGPQKRLLTAYNFNLSTKNKFINNLSVTASYQAIEESRINRRFKNNNLDSRMEKINVLALNADANFRIKQHDVRYGIETNYNDVNSRANRKNINSNSITGLDTRYPDGGSNMSSFAFYATHSWALHPKWILSDGIRFSQVILNGSFNDKTFFPFPFNDVKQKSGALNGNLGLNYLPGNDWKLAVVASSGFRAPNVDDLVKVFESVAGNIIVPNPNLNPEFTYNTEFNISKIIADKVSVELGAFYTRYKNAITVQSSTFNGESEIIYNGVLSKVTTTTNSNRAFIYGYHAQVNAKFCDVFSFNSSVNYTYGRIKAVTNLPLDHIPPLFGKAGLQLQMKKFKSELSANYNGYKQLKNYSSSGEDNLQYATADGMPAWVIFNLRNAYQLNSKFQIQAGLENITDKNYRMFASGVSSAGRNLIMSIRGSF